jgi:general secretion pathway protein B
MSYILEALKRLEQKQKREGLPTLLTPQEGSPEQKRRRPLWLYLILAALLLNAVLTLWWIAPWRSGQQSTQANLAVPAETPTQPAMVTPTPAGKPAAKDTRMASPDAESKEVASPAVSEGVVRKQGAGTTQTTIAEKKPAEKTPPKGAPASATASPSADSRTRTTNAPAPSAKVLSLQDLPPAVKGNLPPLKVSMHYYSDEPRSRLVRINDMTLREGDVLTPPGARVEEIAPAHILFSYQGYRFTVGIDER